MKKFILLALFSLNLFAGDLYLVCEDYKGDIVLDKVIDNRVTGTKVTIHDTRTDKYTLDLSIFLKEKRVKVEIFEMNSGLLIEEDEFKFDYNDRFNFSLGYSCYIVD